MSLSKTRYAEILLPLALERTYTYSIPDHLSDEIVFGKRVEVQFGSRKKYAGLIVETDVPAPDHKTKEIISVLDKDPLILPSQYKLWQWIASYYVCTLGEVMKAALPGALQLSSETVIKPISANDSDILLLEDPHYNLMRIIQPRKSITLDELQKESGLKVLYPHVVQLYQMGLIVVVEQLAEKYSPKKIKMIQLSEDYHSEEGLEQALNQLSRSESQEQLFLAYLALAGKDYDALEPKYVLAKAGVGQGVIRALIQKGIMKEVFREVSRMDRYQKGASMHDYQLTPVQDLALQQVVEHWKDKEVVLLHGVTGSGKTLIYAELIRKTILEGGQVLYMVPEIGMSVQLLSRLTQLFGKQITISHSRLNENERVDLWQQVMNGIPLVAGVRSSIFLPFKNLKLIIVDEEHDPSYKQQDPNPRYSARDMAIVLGQQSNGKVLLGSATPSIESYYHGETGKYGCVVLSERYQGMELPKVTLIDRRKDKSAEGSMYSHTLIQSIKQTLEHNKQVIIFKNRRGYAPVLRCGVCEWVAECPQCDVTMTYHKIRNVMICHLCGTTKQMVTLCPACGSPRLLLEGYGTEKIEDELSVIFPNARIKRMDLDTTRGKDQFESLIFDFERGNIDILVGTQMVTKGLDFDHVGLVGVISADQSLFYPDFRSAERTFQTLVQVSGRAGRKFEQGTVMIQTYQPSHPIFADVTHGDFRSFYDREVKERELFQYPPFTRQIVVTVKHKQFDLSQQAAYWIAMELRSKFGDRILGPSVPMIGRIRNQFLHMIHIKMERESKFLSLIKAEILSLLTGLVKKKSLSTVKISVDVDPLH